jgi:hypothetical protein
VVAPDLKIKLQGAEVPEHHIHEKNLCPKIQGVAPHLIKIN